MMNPNACAALVRALAGQPVATLPLSEKEKVAGLWAAGWLALDIRAGLYLAGPRFFAWCGDQGKQPQTKKERRS